MTCVSCSRVIDATSKLCPYCGANPVTGEKFDTTPLLESHFPRKQDLPAHESMLEFFRHRQWMVITAVVAVLFSVAFFGHRMIRQRNEATAAEVPAVPLTEIADLSGQSNGSERAPIPPLDFQLEGNSKNARILLVEPGAVAPPPDPATLTTTATTTTTPSAGPLPTQPGAVRPGAPAVRPPVAGQPGAPAPQSRPGAPLRPQLPPAQRAVGQ